MYDDDYEIPGAFPSMFGGAAPAMSTPRSGGGLASMFDNPMVMGGMMGLSNLRDPNSMANAIQAMMQMKQSQQMMDYRNRSLDETQRYHNGNLDIEKARSELLRQQMEGQQAQQKMVQGMLPGILSRFQGGQQPTGVTAQIAQQAPPVSDAQPVNNPSAFVAPPQQDQGGPTDPVYDNRSFVQGQSLPPIGQPQPPAQAPINSGFLGADSFVRKAEGGFVGNDAGAGPTNFGINQRANPDVDVKNITPDQAANIRKTRYWDKIGGDSLPPPTAAVAYDAAINQGVGYANNLLERTGGNPALMLQQRRQDYAELGKQPRFENQVAGWNKRLDQLQESLGSMDSKAQSPMQQAAAQAAPPQAPEQPQAAAPSGGGQQIAQVPGLPQIPGMPQQPSGQQGVTAPDDSEQRRNQVAMGLVLTANPATMAEGLKMINSAGETKTYNKGQIVTNANGQAIMVDGPPTVQDSFNNAIAAGKNYREALDTAMKVGKYPKELQQMDAQFKDTQAQTAERQAAAGKIGVETKTAEQTLATKQATDYGGVMGTLNNAAQLNVAAAKLRDNPGLDHITGPYSLLPDAARMVIDPQGMNAKADLNAIGSKILLNTITSLKALSENGSTGFGQLSNVEGEHLKNSVGSLNQAQTTDQMKERLGLVIDNSNKLIDRATSVYEQAHNKSPYEGLPIGTRPAREAGGEPKMSKNGKPLLKLPDGKLMEVNE